jgi:hypothetical protein
MKGGKSQWGIWFTFMKISQPSETNNRRGFTVVETMIFLAVSAALFIAAVRLIGTQQRRAEFTYGIQEFSSQMRDVVNDVSTGYYDYRGNLSCTANATGPPILAGGGAKSTQGENEGCIFIGRVIQFAPDDYGADFEGYRIFTVAGRRVVEVGGSRKETTNLMESRTVPLAQKYGADATRNHVIPNGIRVRWVRYNTAQGVSPQLGINVRSVGFFTNFAQYNEFNPDLLETTARNVDVLPITANGLGPAGLINEKDQAHAADEIYAMTDGSPSTVSDKAVIDNTLNPAGGVTVCLESGYGDLYVLLNLGGNLRQLTSDINIQGGKCPA